MIRKEFFEYLLNKNTNEIEDLFTALDKVVQDDFVHYEITKKDNLMNIAHKMYGNETMWWVLYFFNKMSSTLDTFIDNDELTDLVATFKANILKFKDLTEDNKNYVINMFIDFVESTGVKESPASHNFCIDLLETNHNERDLLMLDFMDYYKEYLIRTFNYCGIVRVPQIDKVAEMKYIMIQHSNSINQS